MLEKRGICMRKTALIIFLAMICVALYFSYAKAKLGEKGIPGEDYFPIYEEEKVALPEGYSPSDWLGDIDDLTVDYKYELRSHSGDYCQRWEYTKKKSHDKGWVMVRWMYPEGNKGQTAGHDLSKFSKVTFWARGDKGRETLEIRIGGFGSSLYVAHGPIKLTSSWKEHTVDLSSKSLVNVNCGFSLFMKKKDNPLRCKFYLDDIKYE